MQDYQAVHKPVLVDEILKYLQPGTADSLLIDATLGEGGHSEAFLRSFQNISVIGVEADGDILKEAKMRLSSYGRRFKAYRMRHSEFFALYRRMEDIGPSRILFDLGISMYHYKKSGRGFGFGGGERLDMRLDTNDELSAYEIVNEFEEKALADIIYAYGEERLSRRIAHKIVQKRATSPITTTDELASLVASVYPYRTQSRIHPATKTFQALRIKVNRELELLPTALSGAVEVMEQGARIGVISFHSLEDRIVKQFLREMNKTCICPPELPICQCRGKKILNIITKKPVVASEQERRANPAARSAKLRVAEKV